MTSNAVPRNTVANIGKVKFLSRLNGFNNSLGLVVAATICTFSFVGLQIDRDMSKSSERLKATLAQNQEAIRSGRELLAKLDEIERIQAQEAAASAGGSTDGG